MESQFGSRAFAAEESLLTAEVAEEIRRERGENRSDFLFRIRFGPLLSDPCALDLPLFAGVHVPGDRIRRLVVLEGDQLRSNSSPCATTASINSFICSSEVAGFMQVNFRHCRPRTRVCPMTAEPVSKRRRRIAALMRSASSPNCRGM